MMIVNIGTIIMLVFNSAFCIAQQGKINIKVSGIKDMKGNIYVYLYSSKDGFPVEPSKADKSKAVKADAQTVTITFNNIRYGYYAVSVYHDEDSNGKMNTYFWGIPKEPVGVSNNAKGFMGPPKYEDAKFYFKNNKQIEIIINTE